MSLSLQIDTFILLRSLHINKCNIYVSALTHIEHLKFKYLFRNYSEPTDGVLVLL